MLISETATVSWNGKNRKYYESLGYCFTKYRDKFEVAIAHLTKGCHALVLVQCDYCGKQYRTQYCNYLKYIKTGKDACSDCAHLKVEDNLHQKFGVSSVFQLEEIKEKTKATCLRKFGKPNPSQAEEIKQKIFETNMKKYGDKCSLNNSVIKEKAQLSCQEHYGVLNPFASLEIQQQIKETNKQKYGKEYISQTEYYKSKVKETSMEKYGVPFITQAPEVIRKMRKSLYQKGKVPSSKPEKIVVSMLKEIYGDKNCIPSFSYDQLNFDCLLKIGDTKIDVEYDGWYWHKDKQEEDKRRNYFLIRRGFKILRIRSLKLLPTYEQIKEAVDKLINQNKHLVYIDLDI